MGPHEYICSPVVIGNIIQDIKQVISSQNSLFFHGLNVYTYVHMYISFSVLIIYEEFAGFWDYNHKTFPLPSRDSEFLGSQQ